MIVKFHKFVSYFLAMFGPVVTLACDGSHPLGVSTGVLADDAIMASSTYPSSWDAGCDTKYARLLRSPPGLAWCSAQKSPSEWLQIDLGFVSKITSVASQGRTDGKEWVSAFHLSFSVDGQRWEYVRSLDNGDIRLFAANAESHSVKHNYLEKSIIARYVKFHPQKWHGHPSMRVELFGCQDCSELISVQPWAQVRVSSQWLGRDGNRCRMDNAFLYSAGAWCPKKRDKTPWIEYDFGPVAYVTAIATRGKEPLVAGTGSRVNVPEIKLTEKNSPLSVNLPVSKNSNRKLRPRRSYRPQWVTAFKVFYRNETKSRWSAYYDREFGDLFPANSDASSVKIHYLTHPITARYVRIVPMRWSNYPTMRIGVFGCPNLAKLSSASSESRCPEMFLKPGAETPCVENLAYKKKAWVYMKRHHKRHLPAVLTKDVSAERAVDGDVNSTQRTCMPLNNAQVADPTWMVDIGKRNQISGVLLWLWHPKDASNNSSKQQKVERGLRGLDKIIVFVTTHPVSRAAHLNKYEGKHLCASVKNFENRFARKRKPIHFICTNALVGRYIYVVAIGASSPTQSRYVANHMPKFHTSLCEVQAYS